VSRTDIEKKVASVAGEAVRQKGYVTAVDVLVGLGWLSSDKLEDWRRGRVPYLERVVVANLSKISFAMKALRSWALRGKLYGSETVYKRWGKGPKTALRFSKSGTAAVEAAYCTHFILAGHPKLPGRHAPTVGLSPAALSGGGPKGSLADQASHV
jgi:hypothetical protein